MYPSSITAKYFHWNHFVLLRETAHGKPSRGDQHGICWPVMTDARVDRFVHFLYKCICLVLHAKNMFCTNDLCEDRFALLQWCHNKGVGETEEGGSGHQNDLIFGIIS